MSGRGAPPTTTHTAAGARHAHVVEYDDDSDSSVEQDERRYRGGDDAYGDLDGPDGPHDGAVDDADEMDFHEYLFRFGAQYDEHKQALRAAREAEELAQMRSVPLISPHAAAKPREGKIEKRLFDLQRKRQERLAQQTKDMEELRRAKELDECSGYIGAPHITPWAHQLKRRNGESIAEASAKWTEESKRKLDALREDALKRELAEMRPVPRISSSSVASAASTTAAEHKLSVEDRLILQERERQRRMYAKVEEATVEARRNAHPRVNAAAAGGGPQRSHSALGGRGGDDNTTGGGDSTDGGHHHADVVSRLYDPNYKVKPVYDAELVEKCTFQPRVYSRVDPNDDLMKLPVHERLMKRHVAAKEQMLNKTLQRAQQQALQDNVGTPRLSAKSRQLASMRSPAPAAAASVESTAGGSARFGGSPTDRLYGDAQKRREALAQKVHQRRAESANPRPQLSRTTLELVKRDPTFTRPLATEGEAAHDQSAAAVNGLRSFADRQQLYERRLKESERQRKAERLAREEAEMQECTFAPAYDRVREQTRPKGKAKVRMNEESILRRRPTIHEKDFYKRNERWMAERDRNLKAAQEAKDQLELAACDFHPVIKAEMPLPSATVPTAPGMEGHVKRQMEARREKAIIASGGYAAVKRREAAELAAAAGGSVRRVTKPEEFHFRLAGDDTNHRHHAAATAGGPSSELAALRPPVTAADVEAFYMNAYDDDDGSAPLGSSAAPQQRHQHRSAVLAPPQYEGDYEGAHHFFGGQGGPTATAAYYPGATAIQGRGFFGGAYGNAPEGLSEDHYYDRQQAAPPTRVQAAYDAGVTALSRGGGDGSGWGGGGATVESIIRNHQAIYRRTASNHGGLR